MTNEISIIRFGRISENEDGVLVFEDFHIKGNLQFDMAETLLRAVINRLEKELEEHRGNKS